MPIRPVTIPATEVHPMHSAAVDQDYELWVARSLPGFRPDARPPVVLWVLDAPLFFGTAVDVTRLMHRLFGELPPVLVVGVAPATEDFFLQGELRTRDFTPTVDSSPRPPDPAHPPTLPPEEAMGGAAAFRRFLVEEARPYLAERFAHAAGEDVLFGASLGGLFVAHTLVDTPEDFARYLAVSPALWWDKRCVFATEELRSAERTDLPARAFLAVGSREEGDDLPYLAPFKMVSNTVRLAAALGRREYPSLRILHHVFSHETHTSVVPAALTRGLRYLLG